MSSLLQRVRFGRMIAAFVLAVYAPLFVSGQEYLAGRADFAAGNGPGGVAVADFNHDGILDLAISNSADNTVSILLGVRNGTFATKVDYAVGLTPAAIVVADFNRDNKPDIAIANENDQTISVLIGNGDGSFQPQAIYAAGYYPVALVAGDFNGDHKTDLAAVNLYDNTVSVFMGQGDGTLHGQVAVAVGLTPTALVSADLNRDGRSDLVTANIGSGTLSVLLGQEDGTFRRVDSSSGIAAGSNTIELALADFSRDGKIDAVASDYTHLQFLFLVGNGDGTFSVGSVIPNAPQVSVNALLAADFNQDGKEDLLIPGLYVLPGRGDGTFGNPILSPGLGFEYILAAADVNGDGILDAITNGNSISVLLGNGQGRFGTLSPVTMASGLTLPEGLVAADFNNDGHLDIAVAGSDNSGGEISAELGKGDGTFGPAIISALDADPINNGDVMLAGDFNGDSKRDLVLMDPYFKGFEVALGAGDGSFLPPVNTSVSYVLLGLAAGDFNQDGNTDVVVATNGSTGGIPTLNIFLSNGDGTFTPGAQYPTNFYSSVAVADVNGDGKTDIVATSFGSGLQVFLGKGDSTFSPPIVGPVAIYSTNVVVGDFNADGKMDIAVGTYTGIAWLPGNGDGTFGMPIYSSATTQFLGHLVAGDFGGDGRLGLANDAEGGGILVMRGNGDGTFQGPVGFGATGFLAGLIAGDFNSDGVSDFAVADQRFLSPSLSAGLLYLSAPTPALRPTSLTFGSVPIGQTSPAKRVALSNTGNATLRLSAISIGGDFQQTNNCGRVLAPGKTCGIQISFKPSSKGTRSGTLNIADNMVPGSQKVALSGTGQ